MKIMKFIGPLILVSLLAALDQWSKHLAATYLLGQPAVVLLPNILSLTYHINPGAAFGLFAGGRWFFLAFALLVMIAIAVYYIRLPKGRIYNFIRFFLLLIAAGGIGNSIDRFLYGYVIDFLKFDFINFPIFNIADIYVVTGTVLLGIVVVFFVKDEKE